MPLAFFLEVCRQPSTFINRAESARIDLFVCFCTCLSVMPFQALPRVTFLLQNIMTSPYFQIPLQTFKPIKFVGLNDKLTLTYFINITLHNEEGRLCILYIFMSYTNQNPMITRPGMAGAVLYKVV